jgi:hypothetical protein
MTDAEDSFRVTPLVGSGWFWLVLVGSLLSFFRVFFKVPRMDEAEMETLHELLNRLRSLDEVWDVVSWCL